MKIDDIDKKIIYYYRNGFRVKTMAEKLGLELRVVKNRVNRLRPYGLLKRWWDE